MLLQMKLRMPCAIPRMVLTTPVARATTPCSMAKIELKTPMMMAKIDWIKLEMVAVMDILAMRLGLRSIGCLLSLSCG